MEVNKVDGRSPADSDTAGTTGEGASLEIHKIVCIVKEPNSTEYYTLSLQEDSTDQTKSFALDSHQSHDLPQSLLDQFLVDALPEYLCSSESRKLHVVVSTGSGTGLASNFYHTALEPLFGKLGLSPANSSLRSLDARSFALTITKDAHSIRGFARDLSVSTQRPDGPDIQHTVILLSGDGGTIELLNGRAPMDIAGVVPVDSLPLVAMLPLGTGNALFHSLHKTVDNSSSAQEPSPLVLGLRTLLRGKPAALPSFRVDFSTGSRTIEYINPQEQPTGGSEGSLEEHANSISHLYGAIVASYGFHSQLVWESDTPEYRKHGDKRFGMVAAELLKENHAYNAEVELVPVDGGAPRELHRKQHAYILATMVSNLEKTFTISPASRPLDGKLRLVNFGAVEGQKTMDIMMQAYDGGKHVDMEWTTADGKTERVGYDEIKQVKVTTLEEDARWRKVCIDGTIVEIPKGGSMSVVTEKQPHLQVLVHQSLVA